MSYLLTQSASCLLLTPGDTVCPNTGAPVNQSRQPYKGLHGDLAGYQV